MYNFRLLFMLCQLFLLSFCHGDDDIYNDTIRWPETYHFRGEKIYLMSDLIETFEIWYVSEYNNQSMSRKDFYQGTVKTLYFGEIDNATAIEYTIYPMSTEYSSNIIVCEKEESYSSDAKTFLPEPDLFSFQGWGDVEGKSAEVWVYSYKDTDYESNMEMKIWVDPLSNGEYIPLRYETRQYDSWRGEKVEETIVNFYDFHDNVSKDDFTIDYEYGCEEMRAAKFMDPNSDEHIETAFHSFKKEHKKTYKNDKEHNYRKRIFRNNMQRIISKNRQNLSYKLGVTKFADRTKEELQMSRGILKKKHVESGAIKFPHSEEYVKDLVSSGEIPKTLDLRIEGLVRPVEDQLSCGSCWAFTTTAAIEGAVAKKNGGRLLNLSQQSFVDCSWGFGNLGCGGGLISDAFKWALNHGVPTTEDYGPYLETNGYCKMDNMTNVFKIKGFAEVTPLSENAMKVALFKYGPVAATIYASDYIFFYKNGVYYDINCEGETENHGVTVVGYGELNGATYWIIKNSWGNKWGEDGHMLISTTNNNCLLLNEPYYAVV